MALVIRASQAETSSDSNSGRYRYDVFLSFRGEDTRKTFTDHLYTALNNSGFLTFRDDDELERCEDIKPGLQKAIQQSRTSVIVFSKDYASSWWCLDELVMILEQKRMTSGDHVVLPVFYDVDPSHVRKQTGSLAKAFARHHKTQPLKKVKKWREALAEVADLGGMVLQNQADGYESEFIKKIIKVIGDKLRRTPLSVSPNMVGMNSRVKDINLWLQDGSENVGILVIYGMSGIGKSTIAKFAYNSNYRRFEGSSFLANIKDISQQPNGLVEIQKQLLFDVLNGREVKIHSVSEGITKIEDIIGCKRVLLVLDDVDHLDQLDAVLRMKDRFYPGSKIIITTGRARLLKPHQVSKVYQVGTLGYNESLELFCLHAFGQDHPIEGYLECSEKLVQHCGGLPLAIEVLGSSLSGESLVVWKSALEKLEVIPNGEIMNKLRISYDCLQDDHDQKLFLHIACFLIGKEIDHVVRILDGCDFYTIVGIQNLVDRCLVKIDENDKVNMHDMVRDMGREIVRLESEEPRKRSRLWRHKDSFEVLKEKNGTQTIQGLALDIHMIPGNSPVNSNVGFLETLAFARMHRLKLLHLGHVKLDGDYAEFPTGLRWLCWLQFPLDSIPIDFPLESLIVLEMQYSSLRQVCQGTKCLPSLKILDLSHSHGLTAAIDFSFCPNVEKLIFVDCTSLIEIHGSIGNLERLVYLNMKDCKSLKLLPKTMIMLKSLEALILSGCSSLTEFPLLENMGSLKVLETSDIPISQLWPERSLCILSSLPCSLVDLSLSGCSLSDDAFPNDLGKLSSLRRLDLRNNAISSLPNFIKGLTSLIDLYFTNCVRLKSLVGLPKVQGRFCADGCMSLETIKFQSISCIAQSNVLRYSDDLLEFWPWFKLESIGRVDAEMIDILGLCNVESMETISIRMLKSYSYPQKLPRTPIQGLHERGIFSIFLPGNEVPGKFSHKSTGSSSISFKIASLLPNQRILGLKIFVIYVYNYSGCVLRTTSQDLYYLPEIFPMVIAKVSNRSKGLKWIYSPGCYGIPEVGEEMIWLSHWNMENQFEGGDKVVVSLITGRGVVQLQVMDWGIELVHEQSENNMMSSTSTSNQHNINDPCYPRVIGGDLSPSEKRPGTYLFTESLSLPSSIDGFIDSDEEDTEDKEEENAQGGGDHPTICSSINRRLRGRKAFIIAAGFFVSLSLIFTWFTTFWLAL